MGLSVWSSFLLFSFFFLSITKNKKVPMEKEVELVSSELEMASQHISQAQRKKGGLVTMPFIIGKNMLHITNRTWVLFAFQFSWWILILYVNKILCLFMWMAANEALARVASIGLLPNMILYLMGSYKLHLAKATQILLLSSATGNFTPVVGAFIADSYLGRFLAVGLGSIISFLVYSFFLLSFWVSFMYFLFFQFSCPFFFYNYIFSYIIRKEVTAVRMQDCWD